jgi:hypothetical protein
MRTVNTEFPNYDDTIDMPEGWIDTSWRNDVCPSFEKDFGDTTYKIFCNFKDVDKREIGGLQFHVCTYTKIDDSLESESEFNTLEEALAFVKGVTA